MDSQEIVLRGVAISHGVAIGHPFSFNLNEDTIPDFIITGEQIEEEVVRYRMARRKSYEELRRLQKQLQHEHIIEGAAVLEAQLEMMDDPLLTTRVEEAILLSKKNAESAFQQVITQCQQKFNTIADPFFRERFKDVQDIAKRIMGNLRKTARFSLAHLPMSSVVFAQELSAAEVAEANPAAVRAFVTEYGGTTSHAAIVARARGIPYVSSIPLKDLEKTKYHLAIVDGRTGEVILNPSSTTLAKYQHVENQLQVHLKRLDAVRDFKVETMDGYAVRLSANINTASELDMMHLHGGHGVGLYRSEHLFFSKERFPSEEEQFLVYRELVEKMLGAPIVIRTFDVGGDKRIPTNLSLTEMNPFLGCRAIRFLLREKDIFHAQLCAILRVSALGDVSIMFPMVSTLSELRGAKEAIQRAEDDLTRRGESFGALRVGCMIEVPSAALIADLLAKECDFLSIGTNDLVQYALAVDRSNHVMSTLYTPTHPSVLRLIKTVLHEAAHHGVPVTVCGEVAADPRFTPLLLGLGVHELSVATRYIPVIKHVIRRTSIVYAMQFAEEALSLPTEQEIQELLVQEYRRNVPEDCFYNC